MSRTWIVLVIFCAIGVVYVHGVEGERPHLIAINAPASVQDVPLVPEGDAIPPSVIDPPVATRPQPPLSLVPAPIDLPDFFEAEKLRREQEELWKSARAEILAQQLGNNPDLPQLIDAIEERNSSYVSSKAQLLQGTDPAVAISSPQVFEQIRQLNQAYRADLQALMGQPALALLDAEKRRMGDNLTLGRYSIPNDLY